MVAPPKYVAPSIVTVSPTVKFLPPFTIVTLKTVGVDEPSNVILKTAFVPEPEVVNVETSNTPAAPPVPPETLASPKISFLFAAANAALIVLYGKVFAPVAVESFPEFATYQTFLVPSS